MNNSYIELLSRGQEQWAKCDDCSKWRKLPEDALLPSKWTCSDNVWDSSRCTCSAPEEMSPRDLDNLLIVDRDFKKRKILERRNPSREYSHSGLDALASAAVLGEIIGGSGEPSIGATTKHPRHRPGCTCIVCIQPPSGKGKHKPTCTCNVCMTVKRRFKTLMLRKKKRQSEREVKIYQKDECELVGSMSHAVLHIDDSETDGSQNRKQTNPAGKIDLNCPPNRDDMDLQGLSVMNLSHAANLPFDDYVKQNGIGVLMHERHSQTHSENARMLSDEAVYASVGWNFKNGGG